VIAVDRGDHGDDRRQAQEAAVELVRLGDEVVAAAEARAGAEQAQAAADDHSRIEARVGQHRPDQGGGRGLAVGAGDGDAVLEPHQLAEHLGAADHGDAAAARLAHLGVLRRDRRGDHHQLDAFEVVGRVPLEDHGAQLLEPLGGLAEHLIGAAHLEVVLEQDLGDAAHAGAADADEVDPREVGELGEVHG
jgi:hypothetical protein